MPTNTLQALADRGDPSKEELMECYKQLGEEKFAAELVRIFKGKQNKYVDFIQPVVISIDNNNPTESNLKRAIDDKVFRQIRVPKVDDQALSIMLQISSNFSTLSTFMATIEKRLTDAKKHFSPEDYAKLQVLLAPFIELQKSARLFNLFSPEEAEKNGLKYVKDTTLDTYYLAYRDDAPETKAKAKAFIEKMKEKFFAAFNSTDFQALVAKTSDCSASQEKLTAFFLQILEDEKVNQNHPLSSFFFTNPRMLEALIPKAFRAMPDFAVSCKELVSKTEKTKTEVKAKAALASVEDALKNKINARTFPDFLKSQLDQAVKNQDAAAQATIKKMLAPILQPVLKQELEKKLSKENIQSRIAVIRRADDPNAAYKRFLLEVLTACRDYYQVDPSDRKKAPKIARELTKFIAEVQGQKSFVGIAGTAKLVGELQSLVKEHERGVFYSVTRSSDTFGATMKHLLDAMSQINIATSKKKAAPKEKEETATPPHSHPK